MEKTEAIDLLDNLVGMVEDNQENDYDEALKMAISALSVPDTNVGDTISRQAAIDKFEPWLKVKGYSDGELNMLNAVLYELRFLPSAQPEQRYTEEELRVFAHGISLSLLSKRSAQYWQYDEDMATEIKFLERLYDKVVADMGDEQDG